MTKVQEMWGLIDGIQDFIKDWDYRMFGVHFQCTCMHILKFQFKYLRLCMYWDDLTVNNGEIYRC